MSGGYREVMSVRVEAGSRTIFVDLKQNPDGSRFVSLSEVKRDEPDVRSRILIDEAYVAELARALAAVVTMVGDETKAKSYSVEQERQTHPNAYQPWSSEEDERLKAAWTRTCSIEQLAKNHGRAPSAIRSRLEKLGLRSAFG